MKSKLTITIDEDLIPIAKQHARTLGVSLSQLIESGLRSMTSPRETTFSARWRGRLQASERRDPRTVELKKKYL